MKEGVQALQVFTYRGTQVRTTIIDGQPWFCAADVCRVLEISNSRDAVGRLDEDEKGVVLTDTPGGPQEMLHVNEPGLYALILTSRKPGAKAFKRWVTHEVLPEIRKTGFYSLGGYQIPKTLPEALRLAADLAEENERLRPKAELHDRFLAADTAQTMAVVAKSLGTGRDRLFRFLREIGILMANNVPYQQYLDRGYFRVIEKVINMGGTEIVKPQTLVTTKGVAFIAKLLKSYSA